MNQPVAPDLTCRICGTANSGKVYTAKEMQYGTRETFDYFQCTNCGCLQIREIPADLGKYYPSNYYSFKPYNGKKYRGTKGKLKLTTYQASLAPENAAQKLLAAVSPSDHFKAFDGLNITRQSRILDVGCGNGDKYLYQLREMGYEHVMGCDPFIDQTIDYPNGLVIKKQEVFAVEGQWDLIIYNHSMEHVTNPLENLQQVKKLLAPGGVCMITVPTVSSYAWKHYGVHWYQLDAPRHIFLFTAKSMEILAAAAGLKLTRTVSDSDYRQFSISEGYLRDIPMNAPKQKGWVAYWKRKIKKIGYNRRARQLNREGLGDIATYYLAV